MSLVMWLMICVGVVVLYILCLVVYAVSDGLCYIASIIVFIVNGGVLCNHNIDALWKTEQRDGLDVSTMWKSCIRES
jgi:hypothetical protein